MSEFQIKIVRSDNQVFNVDDVNYLIEKISGIDATEITNYFENYASADGVSWGNSQVKGKQFAFSATSNTGFSVALDRKIINSFFRPKFEYKIYVTVHGVTKWCWGILHRMDCPLVRYDAEADFTVSFDKGRYEPNSTPDTVYWRDVDDFAKNIAGVQNMLGYPHYDQPDIGFAYDVFNFAQTVELDNNGDFDTSFIAVLTCTAAVENPYIARANNKVEILDTMQAGDVYELNFVNGTVTKNGADALANISKVSDFSEMFMKAGVTSRISYGADIGTNVLAVTVYYDQLYGGVL